MKEDWSKAKKDAGNIALVLDLVKKGLKDLIRGRKNIPYPFELSGQQRRSLPLRGEAIIESILLSSPENPKKCLLKKKGLTIKELEFKANATGLGNRAKDNIKADLLGFDEIGTPVVGEVKITDNNPWYAVVECVMQVSLLRSDRRFLKNWVKKERGENSKGKGTWGLVIAPEKYWRKKETKDAKQLVEELRNKTNIRICCVSYDEKEISMAKPEKITLNVIFGNPPSTRSTK